MSRALSQEPRLQRPNNSFKPSPLRGLGHTGPQRAGRLNSGVRPLTTNSGKPGKLEKLIAVYEHFAGEIEPIPDPWALKLAKLSKAARSKVEMTLCKESGATKSQLASGLEQGIRDTPEFIAMISPEWRAQVAKALDRAIQTAYPEFLVKDAERLEKIRVRGKIRTISEYYFIRHKIDALEGTDNSDLLIELYEFADTFESKV